MHYPNTTGRLLEQITAVSALSNVVYYGHEEKHTTFFFRVQNAPSIFGKKLHGKNNNIGKNNPSVNS